MRIVIIILSLLLSLQILAQDDDSLHLVELTQKLSKSESDTSRVNILNELATEYIGSNNEMALNYSKKAINLSKKLDYKTGLSKAYYNIGKCFYYEYEFDSIIYYYELSLEVNKNKENLSTSASYKLLIGLVYQIQSDYALAITHFKEALSIYSLINDKEKSAYCYNNIGAAFFNIVNYEKALENYFKSLSLNEEIENTFMIAKTLANIGGIYYDQEKFNNALEYYKKAIVIAAQVDSKQTLADTYRNMGAIYTEKNNFDSTLFVYETALSIYKELNDTRGIIDLYNRFGQTYVSMTDTCSNPTKTDSLLNLSKDYYNRSLELNTNEINQIEQKILSYQGLGEIYYHKKQYVNSIKYLNIVKEMADENRLLFSIKSAHEFLSKAYSKTGDYKKAFENQVLYKNWSDSLKNDENIELLTQTSMQYEFDKQQKEQEFIQAQKDLEYQQKEQRDKLIRAFILAVLIIVSGFSVQVFRSYQRKKRDNILLEEQKTEIEKQKEEITDSIKYAKRIQTAILPSDDWANENLPEHFILFRPRDIVSGDYYWMNKIGNKVILVAADCTGHGVPGAFMSMLGVSFLNEIVNKNHTLEPQDILNQLRNQVKRTLDQTGKDGEAKDGMDIALCVVDFDTMKLEYAGAYNPLYLYRKGELIETKADKMPIGIYIREKESFTKHEIQLEKGDTFYIFSDGYADQFGGPNGGKFKSKAFKELLAEIQPNSMLEQWEILESTIDNWRGDIDQIDDMIVLGVRV